MKAGGGVGNDGRQEEVWVMKAGGVGNEGRRRWSSDASSFETRSKYIYIFKQIRSDNLENIKIRTKLTWSEYGWMPVATDVSITEATRRDRT